MQNMITHCKLAKEAWERLEKFLSPICSIHVRNLREKLRNTKKTATMPMVDYLMIKRTVADTLQKAGVDTPESDMVAFTLEGLDHTYIRVKSFLQMQKNITFDELLLILLSEEDLINQNQPPEVPAMFVANKSETEQQQNDQHGKQDQYRGRNRRGRGRHDDYYDRYDDRRDDIVMIVTRGTTMIVVITIMIGVCMMIDAPTTTSAVGNPQDVMAPSRLHHRSCPHQPRSTSPDRVKFVENKATMLDLALIVITKLFSSME